MRILQMFLILGVALISATGAAQTPAVPYAHWELAGQADVVALGKDSSGTPLVLYQDLESLTVFRWEPHQGLLEDLGFSVAAMSARGPSVTLCYEVPSFTLYGIHSFPIDGYPALPPFPPSPFLRLEVAQHLRGSHTGNASWTESNAVWIAPGPTLPVEQLSTLSQVPPANRAVRALIAGNDVFATQFFDPSLPLPWIITSYYHPVPTPPPPPRTTHVQSEDPQLDLFPTFPHGSIVHRGSLQTLERRLTDFPHDIKGRWDFSHLNCTEIRYPQIGGHPSDVSARLAFFHGVDCVDGTSVLYVTSLVTNDLYLVGLLQSNAVYEAFEDGIAFIDDKGFTNYLELDLGYFPAP